MTLLIQPTPWGWTCQIEGYDCVGWGETEEEAVFDVLRKYYT